MRAVILAGGSGSRLHPLTKVTNKHLLPIGRFPMIYYPIFRLKEAGFVDLLIVTGKEHMGSVVNLLGSGTEFGLSFTYRVQDRAGGIADALALAEDFSRRESVVVHLADNIFQTSLKPALDAYKGEGAMILLKQVSHPEKYGVARMANNRVVEIIEKPKKRISDFAVTGVYIYDPGVFDIIRTLKPSVREELEITDVNNIYLKKGKLDHRIVEGWWADAGEFDTYPEASKLAAELEKSLARRLNIKLNT